MLLHSSGHNITKTLTVPDDIALPLVPTDYLTIDLCTKALREGRLGVAAAQNFLYCSILVPHPPCVHSQSPLGFHTRSLFFSAGHSLLSAPESGFPPCGSSGPAGPCSFSAFFSC